MKIQLNHQVVAAFGLLFTLSLQPSTLLAQGSLTPPGAPAPTMKTLAQIEPRTPITNATTPVTISVPGSYYLTTNLTVSGGNAITIATNGVTLDLNGFTISSTTNPAAGTAVLISGRRRNITIQNGHIQGGVTNNGSGVFSGPGFAYGVKAEDGVFIGVAQNVRVSGVSIFGCGLDGISLTESTGSLVENCVVRTVGQFGIWASTIRGCVALDCGGTAIFGHQVSDSRGESVGSGYGLYVTTAQNCYGYSSSGYGLYAITALNCYGYSSSGTGLYGLRTAIGCYGISSIGYGLYAGTAQNCYGSSTSSTGLSAGTAQNCYGFSTSGPRGLYAQNAAFCTGYRSGGRAIEATIANGCWANVGTNFITYRYNMPASP